MSERQKQHHGRSEGDDREIPGRDVEGSETVSDETREEIEESRDIARAVDESFGWDEHGNRYRSTADADRDAQRLVDKDRDHP
jgi:hypothetical protein